MTVSRVIKFFIVCGLLAARSAVAAELLLVSPANKWSVGDEQLVSLVIDTQGEAVNALELSLLLPDGVTVKNINEGGSFINYWTEQPRVEGRKLLLAGVTPGGYEGGKALVVEMILGVEKEGAITFEQFAGKLFKHDGLGTPIAINFNKAVFWSEPASSNYRHQINDDEPPEIFFPSVAASEAIYDGKNFLVFATQDKGSGIDHYEVKEGQAEYRVADSPYQLSKQKLTEPIWVKAVDKKGNERVVYLPPTQARDYQVYWFFGIIILAAICCWLFLPKLWRRKN